MNIKTGRNPNTGKQSTYCKCCGNYGLEPGATDTIDGVISAMTPNERYYTCDICGQFGTLADFERWGKNDVYAKNKSLAH